MGLIRKYHIQSFPSAGLFLAEAEEFYRRDLVQNILPLYVAQWARSRNERTESYLVRDSDGKIVFAAFRSLPFHFFMSPQHPEDIAGAADLMEHIVATSGCPGLTGPARVCGVMAQHWARLTGGTVKQDLDSTVYAITQESLIISTRKEPPPGQPRKATLVDLPQLIPLMQRGSEEMGLPPEECDPLVVEATLRRAISEGGQLVWDDDGIAATLRAIAVAPVMCVGTMASHPDRRRRGYMSALVRVVVQGLNSNASGFQTIIAHSDLKNMGSHKTFLNIGFHEIDKTRPIPLRPLTPNPPRIK